MYTLNNDNILKAVKDIDNMNIPKLLSNRYLVYSLKKHKLIDDTVYEKGDKVIITLNGDVYLEDSFEIIVSPYNSYSTTSAKDIAEGNIPCDIMSLNSKEFKEAFELDINLSEDINRDITALKLEHEVYKISMSHLGDKCTPLDIVAMITLMVYVILGIVTAIMVIVMLAEPKVSTILTFTGSLLTFLFGFIPFNMLCHRAYKADKAKEEELTRIYENNIENIHKTHGKYDTETYGDISEIEGIKEPHGLNTETFGESLNR